MEEDDHIVKTNELNYHVKVEYETLMKGTVSRVLFTWNALFYKMIIVSNTGSTAILTHSYNIKLDFGPTTFCKITKTMV